MKPSVNLCGAFAEVCTEELKENRVERKSCSRIQTHIQIPESSALSAQNT